MNVTKIILTRCQIFDLKCTKFSFGWGSAPDPELDLGERKVRDSEWGRNEERKGDGKGKSEEEGRNGKGEERGKEEGGKEKFGVDIFPSPCHMLTFSRWLGGLLVERRTSVSPIRGSIPSQVAAV